MADVVAQLVFQGRRQIFDAKPHTGQGGLQVVGYGAHQRRAALHLFADAGLHGVKHVGGRADFARADGQDRRSAGFKTDLGRGFGKGDDRPGQTP